MLEPRGHADMYGAILTEPVTPGLARRRAVHAQRRLQHDVRPRHHRGHDDRARARPADAGRRRRDDRLRHAGRDDPGARAPSATCAPTRTLRGQRHAQVAEAPKRSRVESVAFVNVPSFVLHGGLTVKLGVAADSRRRRLRRRVLRHRRQRSGGPADRRRASAGAAPRRHGDQSTRSKRRRPSRTRSSRG